MPYCKKGDRPKVFYRFGTDAQKTFQTDYAPIDVNTVNKPVGTTENQNREGFTVRYYSLQAIQPRQFAAVTDYVLYYYFGSTFDSSNGHYLALLGCNQTNWPGLSPCTNPWDIAMGCKAGSQKIIANVADHTFAVLSTPKCPNPLPEKSLIEVSYNGLVIFQDQGTGTISFSVSCANCPDGYHECKTLEYPGYCCLDCNGVANSIRAITNDLRIKNG